MPSTLFLIPARAGSKGLPKKNIKQLGFIAQEVEYIIPELVKTREKDGIKAINYNGLIGVLINAIKEQQEEINNLKDILRRNNLF